MHDSAQPPVGLDHFRATELVVAHIEKYWCPTITSCDFLGGGPFAFAGDTRPHVVALIGEDEYKTEQTLPEFADRELADQGLRISYVHASPTDKHDFPGIEALDTADLLIVSVRRRFPPEAQLNRVRNHVAAGRPVVGLRTASHAFAERGDLAAPAGHAAWPEFDAQVLGGNYTNHHGNHGDGAPRSFWWLIPESAAHPIVRGLPTGELPTESWLYKTQPLAPDAEVLAMGRVEGREPPEPLAWTHRTPAGGRVFYTSLGHASDFESAEFRRLLRQGVLWTLERPSEKSP